MRLAAAGGGAGLAWGRLGSRRRRRFSASVSGLAGEPVHLYIPTSMTFVTGFLIWLALGLLGGFAVHTFYRGPTTTLAMSLFFGVTGCFIGGMLGVAPYVAHDPTPLRFGAMVGAVIGAVGFPFIYHLVARKAL